VVQKYVTKLSSKLVSQHLISPSPPHSFSFQPIEGNITKLVADTGASSHYLKVQNAPCSN
jgi:hypothetical protein